MRGDTLGYSDEATPLYIKGGEILSFRLAAGINIVLVLVLAGADAFEFVVGGALMPIRLRVVTSLVAGKSRFRHIESKRYRSPTQFGT
jgi:hypothetical protein